MDIRLGNGFDVHAFGAGDHVTLCGIKVPHTHGLVGHSDADVGMHAVTDAIYGALAQGDIGQHFPPSDPQWKGAESHITQMAQIMGMEIDRVSVKATTSERLGFTGRGEGIACIATCTLIKI